MGNSDRFIRRLRNAVIVAAIATHPYSKGIIQPGRAPHEPLTELKCHIKYVGIMLTVQIMMSSVEGDMRNGTNQSKYQGNTTGAQMSVAAIGQANAAEDNSGDALLK
jgi:hypothetical protein